MPMASADEYASWPSLPLWADLLYQPGVPGPTWPKWLAAIGKPRAVNGVTTVTVTIFRIEGPCALQPSKYSCHASTSNVWVLPKYILATSCLIS